MRTRALCVTNLRVGFLAGRGKPGNARIDEFTRNRMCFENNPTERLGGCPYASSAKGNLATLRLKDFRERRGCTHVRRYTEIILNCPYEHPLQNDKNVLRA